MKALNMNQFLPNKSDFICEAKPALAGVYYDFSNKVAVASDGHILCVSASAYDANYEREGMDGIIIGRDGKEINGTYPVYRTLLPYTMKGWETIELDKSKLKNLMKMAEDEAKKRGIKSYEIKVLVAGIWLKSKYIKQMLRFVDEAWLHPIRGVLYGKKDENQFLFCGMFAPFAGTQFESEVVLIHKDKEIWEGKAL